MATSTRCSPRSKSSSVRLRGVRLRGVRPRAVRLGCSRVPRAFVALLVVSCAAFPRSAWADSDPTAAARAAMVAAIQADAGYGVSGDLLSELRARECAAYGVLTDK